MTLGRVVGDSGTVFCPGAIEQEIRSKGIRVHGVDVWEQTNIDGVSFTAVPAVDWRGDEQVSWVVEHHEAKFIHCGDTIWDGQWWRIAREHGPFNWAFLPISGVIAVLPGLEPSGLPATLTPKQACVAARLLHAKRLCPIHYGTFNNPPAYAEQPDVVGALELASREERVAVRRAGPGEILDANFGSHEAAAALLT